MKFDPCEKKKISSYEQILNSENYLEIPAEDGRNPHREDDERS